MVFVLISNANQLHLQQTNPLREILENFRKSNDINFVYSDEIVDDIYLEIADDGDLTQTELESLLTDNNISFTKFDNKTYVLYKAVNNELKQTHEQVITDQEIEETDSLDMMIKPILISNPIPPYPRTASKNKIEGSVRIKFLIKEDGRVSQSQVMATSGFDILDSAAKEYVYNLRYRPAEKNGKPHSTWMSMLFRYTLDEGETE